MPNSPAILTNAKFAASDELFRAACKLAAIEPTRRQASKWLNHRGLAWKFRAAAQFELQRSFAARAEGRAS
jgi:hypothetical protein